jgi:NADH dehydrogenase FAD-containing subunit
MSQQRPRVVIVGAGFAGLETAKRLSHAPVEITIIDRHNYHCFQPLRYQVATAALSTADIAWAVRPELWHRQQLNGFQPSTIPPVALLFVPTSRFRAPRIYSRLVTQLP